MILEICETCIKNKERFVQLGVGWTLRELGTYDLKIVKTFIENHYNEFIREGLRYAIEKMDPKVIKLFCFVFSFFLGCFCLLVK